MKTLLKHIIASALYYTGLLHLYITFMLSQRKQFPAVIVNYHRFVDNLHGIIDTEPTVTHLIDNFKEEIHFLKHYFDIVSLDELVDRLKEGKRFSRPTVAITIDDGYKDSYDLLFPVIKKEKVPVTIFLTAGLIGTNNRMWVDKLTDVILNTKQERLYLEDIFNNEIILHSFIDKRHAFNAILKKLKDMEIRERDRYIEEIGEKLGKADESEPVMLDWNEVRQMHRNKVSFGAHTLTHPILTNMPLEDAKKEIAESKRIIEQELGAPVRHFAYPNGRPKDFNEELRNFCKEMGFESISTCDFGTNSDSSDIFALKRIGSYIPISLFAVNLVRTFSVRKEHKTPAVVLGMTVNGLGVIRSLARHRIKVYALDSNKERPAMSTRYAECLVSPDVQEYPDDFKDFLIDLAKKIGTAVLLPTSDAHNEFINNNREVLEPYFKFAMSSKEVMDQLLNKKGQYLLARKLNIPMPETYFPKNEEEVRDIASKLRYPVLLKGLSTGSWRKQFGDKKAVIAHNAQELINAYTRIRDNNKIEPIIQEIIQGDDTRHYKICAYMGKNASPVSPLSSGESTSTQSPLPSGERVRVRGTTPLLTFTLQKIRQYPCDFGIGSSVISTWVPEVAELGLKFMKNVGYWGVGSIEFKKDARDGKFKMIEINPRLWAQNSLPDTCGQNFSLTAYLDILGETVTPKTAFKEGIKWIAFSEDRASFKGYHRQGRMGWMQWLGSVMTGKRVWAIWSLDDPIPFLKAIIQKFVNKISSLRIFPLPFGERVRVRGNTPTQFNNITLDIIRDFPAFLNLRQEWNALLDKTAMDNPFLRHEWLSAWWKGYGNGKELFVVRFQKDGKTIGFAPLMKYRTKLTGIPIKAIGFISNHWTRMAVAMPAEYEVCLEKLIDLFIKTKKTVILAQADLGGDNIYFLKKYLQDRKIRFRETTKPNLYISLEGTWQDYLKNQTPNFRRNFKRELNRLQKSGEVSLIRDSYGRDFVMEELNQVAKRSWQYERKLNLFSREEGRKFYSEIIKEWKDSGLLDFSILKLSDKPISYMFGIKSNGSYFAFETAYDKEFSKYSPGTLLLNMLLEKLYADKVRTFDFGYIADYKKRWTEKFSTMTDLTIFPGTLLGYILRTANNVKEHIKHNNVMEARSAEAISSLNLSLRPFVIARTPSEAGGTKQSETEVARHCINKRQGE